MRIRICGIKPYISAGIAVLYFLICSFATDLEYFIPNILMSVVVFVGLSLIYDRNKNLLTIKNLFFLFFYVLGFYIRYLVLVFQKSNILNFVSTYSPRELTAHGHSITLLYIILFTIFFILGNSRRKTLSPILRIKSEINSVGVGVVIIYIIFTVIYVAYEYLHIRLATVQDFGTYDNLVNNIAYFNRLVAYIYLILYFDNRNIKYILMYGLFIVPYIALSLISLYKGTILLEVLIFLAVMTRGKRVRAKPIILIGVVFLIVFPVISMLRSNQLTTFQYSITPSGIIDYYKDNNPIVYLSDRLKYYDETYFVVNTSVEKMELFRSQISNPVVSFFTNIIPRAIWHNKPTSSFSYLVTHELCGIPAVFVTNATIGEIGEAYIYGYGWLICLLGFFHGYLFRRNDELIEVNNSRMAYSVYLVLGNLFINFAEGLVVGKLVVLLSLIIIVHVLNILQAKKTNVEM